METGSTPPTALAAAGQIRPPALVTVFTWIASQAVLIGALLYFFGQRYTGEVYKYFGLDTDSLGFSTSDYVIRSLNATLPPVVVCALAILIVLAIAKHLDRVIKFIQQRSCMKGATIVATVFVIIICSIVILNGILPLPTASWSRGYRLPIAVLGLAIAVATLLRLLGPSVSTKPEDGSVQDSNRTTGLLLSMMVALFALAAVLWGMDLYVKDAGDRKGRDIANTLRSATSSDFVLYSAKRLAISGTGIHSDPISQEDSRYHFQYSNLRLLMKTPHEYIILPAYWQKGRDHVIVIPIDDSTRFDLIPH